MSSGNKMKYAKIRNQQGQYTDLIPIGVDAENVDMVDGSTLQEKLDDMIKLTEIAPTFVRSNSYKKGEYVIYKSGTSDTSQDGLYRFISDKSANVSWQNSDVEQVILTYQLNDMIKVSTSQPGAANINEKRGNNELWINPNPDLGVEIPTWNDYAPHAATIQQVSGSRYRLVIGI